MAKLERSMRMRSDARHLSWPVRAFGLNQRQVQRGRVALDIGAKAMAPSWSASAALVSRPRLIIEVHGVGHE